MKAVFLYGPGDLRCEDAPRPDPGPGEILVRIRYCGLCGTDIIKIGAGGLCQPAVLGHEIAGVVAAAGKGVKRFREGDRVAPAHHLPCFRCGFCAGGSYSQCPEFRMNNIRPGGFSEYAVVNRRGVEGAAFKIPEKLSFEEACFMETAACCLRVFRKSKVRPGDNVLVVGAGPVGLIHVQLAFLFGALRVIAADRVESRLEAARAFGPVSPVNAGEENLAERVLSITGSKGADVAIITAGSEDAFLSGMKSVSKGGRIVIFGGFPEGSSVKLDPDAVYKNELEISGSYSSSPQEQFSALEMLADGRLRVSGLVSHRFRLEEMDKAVETARSPGKGLKVLIDCSSR